MNSLLQLLFTRVSRGLIRDTWRCNATRVYGWSRNSVTTAIVNGTAREYSRQQFPLYQCNSTNLNLVQFLRHIVNSAEFVDIDNVLFGALPHEAQMLADQFSFRSTARIQRNTPLSISLRTQEQVASNRIQNQASRIDPVMLDKIFEYSVSEHSQSNNENRGQG